MRAVCSIYEHRLWGMSVRGVTDRSRRTSLGPSRSNPRERITLFRLDVERERRFPPSIIDLLRMSSSGHPGRKGSKGWWHLRPFLLKGQLHLSSRTSPEDPPFSTARLIWWNEIVAWRTLSEKMQYLWDMLLSLDPEAVFQDQCLLTALTFFFSQGRTST